MARERERERTRSVCSGLQTFCAYTIIHRCGTRAETSDGGLLCTTHNRCVYCDPSILWGPYRSSHHPGERPSYSQQRLGKRPGLVDKQAWLTHQTAKFEIVARSSTPRFSITVVCVSGHNSFHVRVSEVKALKSRPTSELYSRNKNIIPLR